MVAWSYYPPSLLPRPLDVAWCCWPHTEHLQPGPKPRPVLIRSLARAPHPHGDNFAVEVAFGTSVMTKAYPNNLYVGAADEMEAAGLVISTRFDLELTKRLPWASEFFCIREKDGKGPIIGHLNEASIRTLEIVKQRWGPGFRHRGR